MADFAGYGVYHYTAATGWSQLNAADAALLGVAAVDPGATNLTATITGLPASGYLPEGTPLTLGATVSGGVGADAYSWTVTQNGKTITTGAGSSFSFTPSSTGTYQVALTVTDAADDKASAGGSVVADLAPTVSLVDPTAQAGVAIAFTASAVNPNAGEAAGFTYSWNFGDGKTASGSTATVSHAYSTPGTYTVTVTATDSVGEKASASTTVSVAADLAATITGLPALGHSPEGTKVTLGSSVSGGVGADAYSWTVTEGGATVATGTTASLAFTPSAAGTYQVALTVTDSGEGHGLGQRVGGGGPAPDGVAGRPVLRPGGIGGQRSRPAPSTPTPGKRRGSPTAGTSATARPTAGPRRRTATPMPRPARTLSR